MKYPLPMMMLLSMALPVSMAQPASADSTGAYTLIQGQTWHGVRIGGRAPRSLDTICRKSICYRLYSRHPLPRKLLRKYALPDARYESLAKLDEVVREEDRLRLPADLGHALYRQGWLDYLRHRPLPRSGQ